MSFDGLGLTPELLRAVADQGYTQPTPVQAEAIPLVLAGRDLLAGAQTGTGKTAAFVLPILQLLNADRPAPGHPPVGNGRPRAATGLPIRCLILTPTRELALQIDESVRT
jgi:ATP-dependent RNA helicase RhlE